MTSNEGGTAETPSPQGYVHMAEQAHDEGAFVRVLDIVRAMADALEQREEQVWMFRSMAEENVEPTAKLIADNERLHKENERLKAVLEGCEAFLTDRLNGEVYDREEWFAMRDSVRATLADVADDEEGASS